MPRIRKPRKPAVPKPALMNSPPELSIPERAQRSLQREHSPNDGHVVGLLGQIDGARTSPQAPVRRPLVTWTVVHVADRIEEAYRVLARLSVATRPKEFGNTLPEYIYDRGDLNSQQEGGELERLMRQRNRVVLPASPTEIARMEQSFQWIVSYLNRYPEVSRAVCRGAMWAAANADVVDRCASVGIPEYRVRWFVRQRWHGLLLIAHGLIRDRVPVS